MGLEHQEALFNPACASNLGIYDIPVDIGTKGPPIHLVDEQRFRTIMNGEQTPVLERLEDIENHVIALNTTLNAAAKQARNTDRRRFQWDPQQDRWTRLLSNGDARTIWRAVDWNGTLSDRPQEDRPSEEEFKTHFEILLNTDGADPLCDVTGCPYIPVLDDPFTVVEAERAIKTAKTVLLQVQVPAFFDGSHSNGWSI